MAIVGYMKLLQGLAFSAWRYSEARGWGAVCEKFIMMRRCRTLRWEVWTDDRQAVMNWIRATGGRSMAFDFPTRTLLKTAVNRRLFSQLKTIDGKPTGSDRVVAEMSVTFVDDHDTGVGWDDESAVWDGDRVLQAYAYILTHPGDTVRVLDALF